MPTELSARNRVFPDPDQSVRTFLFRCSRSNSLSNGEANLIAAFASCGRGNSLDLCRGYTSLMLPLQQKNRCGYWEYSGRANQCHGRKCSGSPFAGSTTRCKSLTTSTPQRIVSLGWLPSLFLAGTRLRRDSGHFRNGAGWFRLRRMWWQVLR